MYWMIVKAFSWLHWEILIQRMEHFKSTECFFSFLLVRNLFSMERNEISFLLNAFFVECQHFGKATKNKATKSIYCLLLKTTVYYLMYWIRKDEQKAFQPLCIQFKFNFAFHSSIADKVTFKDWINLMNFFAPAGLMPKLHYLRAKYQAHSLKRSS